MIDVISQEEILLEATAQELNNLLRKKDIPKEVLFSLLNKYAKQEAISESKSTDKNSSFIGAIAGSIHLYPEYLFDILESKDICLAYKSVYFNVIINSDSALKYLRAHKDPIRAKSLIPFFKQVFKDYYLEKNSSLSSLKEHYISGLPGEKDLSSFINFLEDCYVTCRTWRPSWIPKDIRKKLYLSSPFPLFFKSCAEFSKDRDFKEKLELKISKLKVVRLNKDKELFCYLSLFIQEFANKTDIKKYSKLIQKNEKETYFSWDYGPHPAIHLIRKASKLNSLDLASFILDYKLVEHYNEDKLINLTLEHAKKKKIEVDEYRLVEKIRNVIRWSNCSIMSVVTNSSNEWVPVLQFAVDNLEEVKEDKRVPIYHEAYLKILLSAAIEKKDIKLINKILAGPYKLAPSELGLIYDHFKVVASL